jgi:hypothetical protein
LWPVAAVSNLTAESQTAGPPAVLYPVSAMTKYEPSGEKAMPLMKLVCFRQPVARIGADQLSSVAAEPSPPPVLISASRGIDWPSTLRNVPAIASVDPSGLSASVLTLALRPLGGSLIVTWRNDLSRLPVVPLTRATFAAMPSTLPKLPARYRALPLEASAVTAPLARRRNPAPAGRRRTRQDPPAAGRLLAHSDH